MEKIFHILNRVRAKAYTFLLVNCFYHFGKKSTIIPPLRYDNLKMISIGNHTTIHSNCWIQTIKKENESICKPKLIIMNHVGIGMNTTISASKKIILEDYVFTARNVFISDHLHKYENINIPISLQSITKIAEIRIGEGTWLCQNSVILPGTTIGKNCVIGANSVVNINVPDYSVVAGAPAKVIKQYDPNDLFWKRLN
jgi:acetyltransferase-like isoleucine patch superfamily enzyme